MTKYHFNPDSGAVNPCNAKIQCEFGADAPHGSTKEEARELYEKTQVSETLPKAVKTTRNNKTYQKENITHEIPIENEYVYVDSKPNSSVSPARKPTKTIKPESDEDRKRRLNKAGYKNLDPYAEALHYTNNIRLEDQTANDNTAITLWAKLDLEEAKKKEKRTSNFIGKLFGQHDTARIVKERKGQEYEARCEKQIAYLKNVMAHPQNPESPELINEEKTRQLDFREQLIATNQELADYRHEVSIDRLKWAKTQVNGPIGWLNKVTTGGEKERRYMIAMESAHEKTLHDVIESRKGLAPQLNDKWK